MLKAPCPARAHGDAVFCIYTGVSSPVSSRQKRGAVGLEAPHRCDRPSDDYLDRGTLDCGRNPAPLAHVAEQVFLELTRSKPRCRAAWSRRFGEHEKVAPVDPDHGYPELKLLRRTDVRCARDQLYDGYPYPIRAATVWPDGRMTVWLSPDEMYDDWCVLQTSYPGSPQADPEGTTDWDHTCVDLPVSQYRLCGGDPAACPIDYEKFHLCNERYCHCTENGCRAPFLLTVRLDLAVVDQRMEGVIRIGNYSPGAAIKLRWVE